MSPRVRNAIVVLGALLLIFIIPQVFATFAVSLLNDIGIAALVVLGLILVSGIGGAISFGQAAFVGIAAYASAWLVVAHQLSPWTGLLFALVLTCGSAWAIGAVTMRLGGHYLALSTIAWGLAVPLVIADTTALGAHSGIDGIAPIQIGPWVLDNANKSFVLVWLILFFGAWFAYNLLGSRVGRTMRALRGGKILLASFGADAFRVRLTLFVVAAAYAALAGWLYAHVNRYINTAPFSLHASIDYVFMMVVGGAAQLGSALIGSALYIGLNNFLQDLLPHFTSRGSQINSLVFALLFLLILERMPGGVGRPLSRLMSRLTRRSRFFRSRHLNISPDASYKLSRRALPQRGTPLVSVKKATKRFGGLVAVNDVSFDVHAGEIVGLIGPNGAGKSTMFNLLTGTLPLTDGAVRLLDVPTADLSQREIALLGVARTFQHVKLRPRMTLLENVALGAYARGHCGLWRGGLRLNGQEEHSIMAEALRQLERVGLADQAYELAGSLPLGTQRLLEIARALASDPVLVMLDEPAAGLRLLEKQALARLLDTLRSEGVTVLIVEHDMEFVMNLVDRLVVMNFGSKISEGNPAQVRADPEVQAAYLGGDA
ncbi:ATP-binding cassette domain-containing protein [Pusillimonas noertemannii]|uniref:Branched-chain amino acid transport system permease protein n=1 Tax=Pusillimonas noertemannii TaxID=305977 RepID=A0A2U1CLU1_9BURK|nr:branched-chain amino acid ABC transporter ATP-binding protein/permease [Pusillimonas noertemannii]NYT69013.1 branched-chain amino acid ABC transporter ATP-binding protein/permease [Pusillimonas noertemannii]PVY61967.1 branched-chain amino acid transport system permease protein [Pusillimonas noertemannii]TFL11024.1 branched-chain amino acid ABC transporter ATP-binding protein/permease [Pusillimonas noertemannii]